MRTRSSRFFVAESVIGAGWSAATSGLVAVLLLSACPQAGMPAAAEDAGLPPILEAGMPIRTVGLFASCTPEGAGYTDVRCQDGLRCATVLVGDPASGQGALTQCVPIPKAGEALTEGKACAFDREAQPQTEPRRFWDQCAAGLICAPTPQNGLQCRRPCEIRQHGTCGKKELCVLPTQVSGLSYCSSQDGCQPVAPQSGCPRGGDGQTLNCYVLGDSKNTGTVCLAKQPWGQSDGQLDSSCERSWSCAAGLACVTKVGREQTCRPYCTLPERPDGGTPPDGGTEVRCMGMLGTCNPIVGYERVGRCY